MGNTFLRKNSHARSHPPLSNNLLRQDDRDVVGEPLNNRNDGRVCARTDLWHHL